MSLRAAHEILNDYLKRKKSNNKAYSLRAFARDLELSPSFVSEVLKGKKKMAHEKLEEAIRILDIDHESAGDLLGASLQQKTAGLRQGFLPEKVSSESEYEEVEITLGSNAQREVLRCWYLLPMLELAGMKDFDGNFASSLGISSEAALAGVRRLIELGLLRETNGRLVRTHKYLKFSAAGSLADFRFYHREMMKRASLEMDKTSPEDFSKRLVKGHSVSLDSARVDEFRKKLSDLMREFTISCEQGNIDSVYHLGIQFVPIAKAFQIDSKKEVKRSNLI